MIFKRLAIIALFPTTVLAAQPQEIHIGLASNFSEVSTGSSNPYGGYFKDGVTLALREFESRLKKKNLSIILDEFDYGNSDIKVLDATRKAIASKVIVVLGYNYSSNALLAAPLHQQAKLPMLTPSASAVRLGTMGRYIHMGCFDNNFMGEALGRLARTKLKAKRALVLPAGDCAYCNDLANSFEKSFEAGGGVIAATIPVLLDDKDFSSVIERIKSVDFDVVLIPNQELTSARMIAALSKAGIKKPFLGADGWGNVGQEFFGILKGASFTGYSVSHWHPDLKTVKSTRFVTEYQKAFGKIPNDTSVLAYDATLLLLEAITSAQSYTREGVENALNALKSFDGVTGHFQLKPNLAPRKSIILLKANQSKFQIVEQIDPKQLGGRK
jgi:branched-chain amino acid transport system substrate-binding protein